MAVALKDLKDFLTPSGTPKYWREYLEALREDYEIRHERWKKDAKSVNDKLDSRPFVVRIFADGHWKRMEVEWQEPYPEKPTLVGYYNWTVEERLDK